MRLIDNIIITTSLLLVIAGFTSGHLWGSVLVLVGVAGTIYTYRACARRDFPDGILNAIPDPEDILAMFNLKKED